MADYHYSAKQSKKVKLENDEPSPTLIINQVRAGVVLVMDQIYIYIFISRA